MTTEESSQQDVRTSAKRKRETAASRASKAARTSTSNAYARRTPPRARSPERRQRSRSRSRSRSGSPPRKLKRPGARATADRGTAIQLQRQREDAARAEVVNRQTSAAELVAEHYNAVPERGREWRSTESRIKGLRSVNNWIKSTLIQKFSRPDGVRGDLLVLDMACGKGGDLGKWEKAPIVPSLYVGCDIADVSVGQARQRYDDSAQQRQRKGWRGGPSMKAEFHVLDAFGHSLAELPIVRSVGFDPGVGPGGGGIIQGRMGGGGFDVVSMMFALHYSFESEVLARGMLKNVAGALRKGGRFIGVMPNSTVISATLQRLLAAEKGTTPSTHVNGSVTEKADVENGSAVDKPEEGEVVEEDDEWDPEKPSEPQPDIGKPAEAEDEEDDWDPEKPSEPVPTEDTAIPDASQPAADEKSTPISSLTPGGLSTPVEWGNSLYSIRFSRVQAPANPQGPPRKLPQDGVFRPPFGWKYHYSLQEAVDTPEFVVPFEALRALAEEYGLELMYRKGFREVYEEEKNDIELGRLAERMGVMSRDRSQGNGTGCLVSEEEWEAAAFYTCFVFYKT